jgi:hypothetical protein
MKCLLLVLVSSLFISACGSSSAPEEKVEPKIRMLPEISTTSGGAVVINRNSSPYEHLTFVMRGYNTEKMYFYRAPNMAPGQQLDLRWNNFKDDTGKSVPENIQPETLSMGALVKGSHLRIFLPIGN